MKGGREVIVSLSQGRNLVVPFTQHANEGDGFSSFSSPFVCHPSQSLERDKTEERMRTKKEDGGLVTFVGAYTVQDAWHSQVSSLSKRHDKPEEEDAERRGSESRTVSLCCAGGANIDAED